MKPPKTFAPVYVTLFPHLARIANECGYALAAHGSIQRDLDLVAIPWIVDATSMETLVDAMAGYLAIFKDIFGTSLEGPVDKPHGRKAWLIATGFGSAIDLSIMPMAINEKPG